MANRSNTKWNQQNKRRGTYIVRHEHTEFGAMEGNTYNIGRNKMKRERKDMFRFA